jgi:superfamily I DNA/RNA helicase
MEAILGSTASPVPSSRVRKQEKLALREQALQEVSRLWRAVLKQSASLWKSLDNSFKDAEALTFAHDNLRQLFALFDSDDVSGLLGQIGRSLEPWRHVGAFAEEVENWVSKYSSSSEPGSDAAVRVMTLQGAKGLEADTVCVLGLEDGVIPRSGSSKEDLAEWSRLLFVSMTRAKVDLHLFHARNRPGAVSFKQIHAKGAEHTLRPSRFLAAIHKDFCRRQYHAAQG